MVVVDDVFSRTIAAVLLLAWKVRNTRRFGAAGLWLTVDPAIKTDPQWLMIIIIIKRTI